MIVRRKNRYGKYYLMDENGVWAETTRKICFAPPDMPSEENPYKTRWLSGLDYAIAIRLPRNELGESLGKYNEAEWKREEREAISKTQCVYFGSNKCQVDCSCCTIDCDSNFQDMNGSRCTEKCKACDLKTFKFIELDKPYADSNESISNIYEAPDSEPFKPLSYKEFNAELRKALDIFNDEDRRLFIYLAKNTKKKVIAEEMGITVDGVRYREKRLRERLRSETSLYEYLKNQD